jgi:hypothetical protein
MTEKRTAILFLLLTLVQITHSIEEFISELFNRFPIVTGEIHAFISIFPVIQMHKNVFAALNVFFVVFLLAIGVNLFKGRPWAFKAARIFAFVEIVNGVAHISAAIYAGGYFPGCISAAGLLIMGILLAWSTKYVKIFHRVSA